MASRELNGVSLGQEVTLCGAGVNDEWIESIEKMVGVTALGLYQTNVTKEGIEWLQKTVPTVRVIKYGRQRN